METNKIRIYTDGSWTPGNPNHTYGGIVIFGEDRYSVLAAMRCDVTKPDLVKSHANGGEMMAAMMAMVTGCQILEKMSGGKEVSGTLEILHDYIGVKLFVQGPKQWTPQKPGPVMYKQMYLQLRQKYPGIEFVYTKVKAHSGIMGNEMADAVANGFVPVSCQGKMLEEVTID